MNELNSTNSKSDTLEPDELVRTILYGDENFDNDSNLKILTVTINFIKQTQQYEQALYWANEIRICNLTLWNRHVSLLVKIYSTKYFFLALLFTRNSKELLWFTPVFKLYLFSYC